MRVCQVATLPGNLEKPGILKKNHWKNLEFKQISHVQSSKI